MLFNVLQIKKASIKKYSIEFLNKMYFYYTTQLRCIKFINWHVRYIKEDNNNEYIVTIMTIMTIIIIYCIYRKRRVTCCTIYVYVPFARSEFLRYHHHQRFKLRSSHYLNWINASYYYTAYYMYYDKRRGNITGT